MKKVAVTFALCFLTSFSLGGNPIVETIQPNTFNYMFIEAKFIHKGNRGSGFRLDGSFDIDHNIAAMAGIRYTTKNDTSYTLVSAGAAYHQQIMGRAIEGLDFIAHAAFEEAFDNDKTSDKSYFGVKVGTGVRCAVKPKLEAFGDFSVATTGGSEIFIKGGVRYTLMRGLTGVASYEFSNNNTLSLGLRYTL